ncbi:MAG: sulfatase-like hydrolase/transferase, partial [Pyramidobacter sp.]|nr:sulfatase-like hydrolase/transferase [Pyramidobacter sp.]
MKFSAVFREKFLPLLVRSAALGLGVFLLYRLALSCGWIVEKTDTFATPWPVVLQHLGLELACSCFFSWVIFCCGARYAALYALFFTLELTVAYLCRMPVGVYEFVCLGSFPAVYALAAYLLPVSRRPGSRLLRASLMLFVLFGVVQYGIYIAYILRFGGRVSPAAIVAALGTNPEEAQSFLVDQFGLKYVFIAAAVIGAAALAAFCGSPARKNAAGWLFLALASCLAFGYRSKAECYSTLLFDVKHGIAQHRLARETLASIHREVGDLDGLHVTKRGRGEVCLVVIGESANRLHLNCFGYDRPTTPWMSSAPVLLFKNAYACMVHTDPALTMALGRLNNYAPEVRAENASPLALAVNSPSLPEVLRAAGVKTFWLSSQDQFGAYGNFVTACLALNTDRQIFTREDMTVPSGAIMQFKSILH